MSTRELELETRQLAQSKMHYADLFDFAPIGYCAINSRGSISEMNLPGARLLGRTPSQVVGHKFEEYVAEEEKQAFREHLVRCRTSGRRLNMELNLEPLEDEPIVVDLYTVATRDAEDGELQTRCAIVNITDRKRAERALKESQNELEMRENMNRMKDEFMARISHELKTPLTPILGAMYRLRLIRADDADVLAMADMVERNAQRESRIVDDLLDVSRISSGKMQLTCELVDLGAVIDEAIESCKPVATAKSLQFEVSSNGNLNDVWGDRSRLQQAVGNVISNAVKFSIPGGIVNISTSCDNESARIVVADQGEGIAKEFLPHVFEAFRQADRFITRSHGGLGLGLSIANSILQAHGGTLSAESEGVGKGAAFIIEIPKGKTE